MCACFSCAPIRPKLGWCSRHVPFRWIRTRKSGSSCASGEVQLDSRRKGIYWQRFAICWLYLLQEPRHQYSFLTQKVSVSMWMMWSKAPGKSVRIMKKISRRKNSRATTSKTPHIINTRAQFCARVFCLMILITNQDAEILQFLCYRQLSFWLDGYLMK